MIVKRMESFTSLKEDWNDLLGNTALKSIFQRYEWIDTWWNFFGKKEELVLLAAFDNGRIEGIAPLMRSKMKVRGIPFFRTIQFIGKGVSDYTDFLLKKGKEAEILTAFVDYLIENARKWDLMMLGEIPEDSGTVHIFEESLGQKGLSHHSETSSICPYIDLPTSWEHYKTTLSRTTRANMKSYFNRLLKNGTVELVKVMEGADVIRAIDEYFKLLGFNQKDIDDKEFALCNFFREILGNLSGYTALFSLTLNGRAIASMYCYDYEKTRYYYGLGWDREYAHCSSGFITISKVIEDTIDNGFKRFDFLRGSEPYKFHFTKTEKRNKKYLISLSRRTLEVYRLLKKLSSLKRKYVR